MIERILRENRLDGASLLGFGDGYVEIQNIKAAGGTAVAVASDEAGRSGRPDPWKRDRLIGAGADIVIPDYRDYRPAAGVSLERERGTLMPFEKFDRSLLRLRPLGRAEARHGPLGADLSGQPSAAVRARGAAAAGRADRRGRPRAAGR